MKRTWKLLTTGSLLCAVLASGCATSKSTGGPRNLTTQQLHNIAEPESSGSWLPKFMQSGPPQPKFGGSDNISNLATANDAPQAKNAKPKKSDPLTMARLQERRGQTDQAIKVYERELATNPRKAFIHHRLAVIAAKSGEWVKAREHFTQSLRLEPKNSEVLGDLGYALYLQHQLPEAESCLRAAVDANPRNKAAQNNLGIVLGVQGKFEESLASFRRAVPDAEAHANLGYVHMQLGDADQAMNELNHALTLDSSLKTAALALVQINDLKQRLGPKDLDRMTLAAKQPVAPARGPSQSTETVLAAQVAPAPVVSDNSNAAIAAQTAPAPNHVAAQPIDAGPTVLPEQQVAAPSVFQRQLAGYMAADLKSREVRPAPQLEVVASLGDRRITEIPERLPAPSSHVNLHDLGNQKPAATSLVAAESTKLPPVTPKKIPSPAPAPAPVAQPRSPEQGSQPIATTTDPKDTVVLASAQVNSVPPNRAPALLPAALPERVTSASGAQTSANTSVQVHKPSARIQQIRENDRAAIESKRKPSRLDTMLAAKLNEERISLKADDAVVAGDGILAHSQTLRGGNNAIANADLVKAVQGAQAAGAKTSVVNPTSGAVPTLSPEVNMPRPEDLMPQHSQLNQLPTHRLHPTANPTWTAPNTPTPNPANSQNSSTGVKGPLPRVKVMAD